MANPLEMIGKGFHILGRRFREDGAWVTIQWIFARGLPYLTGIPTYRYSQITPDLYVGPQHRANALPSMRARGITATVNMRIEHDDAEHGETLDEYCYLPTVDDTDPSMAHLEEGVAFITRVIAEGGKVYIHCAGGIGRAPTMAAAYFVSTGMSLDEAVALIKKTRPFINIMPPQWDVLREYESKVRG